MIKCNRTALNHHDLINRNWLIQPGFYLRKEIIAMGCDGYLRNLEKPKVIFINCYECSQPINLNDPLAGHKNCVKEYTFEIKGEESVLRIMLELEDYLER